MSKKFSELRARMRPEAQLEAQSRTESLQTSIKLQNLRKSLHVTQAALAETLQVQQAAISKMENREDLLVSSAMDFVRALGGQLILTANFPGDRTFDLTPDPGPAPTPASVSTQKVGKSSSQKRPIKHRKSSVEATIRSSSARNPT
ncbi:helix-turn-helix domain-containing protein [Herbaspirillum frisingense]|uniref:helix-turn-helix domain-containing protein n=1 Tax=Herbaspirillum frisingense TaxID=92645 RepID=UPI001602E16B|nr:helix-turn-helix domain-containing protein [Herbaspirillum frisingense]